jgi:hypothetical protein
MSPSQGRYLHTGQHKHRINAYTNIHALSGIRTYDPSVQVNEDNSCLRPHVAQLLKIPRILWNPKIHHRVHKSSSICPYHELDKSSPQPPILHPKKYFNIVLPSRFRFSKCSFSGFVTKVLYAYVFCHVHAICPAKLSLVIHRMIKLCP